MTIETSADWWRTVERNWDELAALFAGCELDEELSDVERLKRCRDVRIARRLQAARRRAPHRRVRRQHHGWQVLFDLCAEQWVLHQPVA